MATEPANPIAQLADDLAGLNCGTITFQLNPVVGAAVSKEYVAVTSCPATALRLLIDNYSSVSLEHGRVLFRPADRRP